MKVESRAGGVEKQVSRSPAISPLEPLHRVHVHEVGVKVGGLAGVVGPVLEAGVDERGERSRRALPQLVQAGQRVVLGGQDRRQ